MVPVQTIVQRLSLRAPQAEALKILTDVVGTIGIKRRYTAEETARALTEVQKKFPAITDFERNFPSICFDVATGVGKTRLMGAFIAWLRLELGVRNFFVLAPNLTIYEKLIADFTPNTPKYVFTGLGEFAQTPPMVITGENYAERIMIEGVEGTARGNKGTRVYGSQDLFDAPVYINIFNVSKINAEVRGGKAPKIKRLSEYLGQSYFEYLQSLPDLVLLMDESHRYRGDAGVRVLDELQPTIGLELTATPQEAVRFKNVIYSYPLARALKDGFVKEPAVATRKDFDAKAWGEQELEWLKLEDGVRLHESVKVDLQVYAAETGAPLVKPFLLVIAKKTEHADAIRDHIMSEKFFGGRYKDKVITVHSNQKGEEKDETVQRLLQVEKASEPTEIVIHVDKLKEGWDVTNLYTIVPLRAANSKTLIEQSIGRGLRLPFGKRVADPNRKSLDRLTIVAHDNFQEIIDEANKADSPLRNQLAVVEVPTTEVQAIVTPPTFAATLWGETPPGATITPVTTTPKKGGKPAAPLPAPLFTTEEEKTVAKSVFAALDACARDAKAFPTLETLTDPRAQAKLIEKLQAEVAPQQQLFPSFKEVAQKTVEAVVAGTIGVPRIVVVPTGEVTSGFKDFDLDASRIHFQPSAEAIIRKDLRDTSVQDELGVVDDVPLDDKPEYVLIAGLMDKNDIDYHTQSELLHKLAGQGVSRLREYLKNDEEVWNVVRGHKRQLVDLIHSQMQPHFWTRATGYEGTVTAGFVRLEPAAFSTTGEPRDVRATLDNKLDIRNLVFTGFKRCLFPLQKFESDPERRFALLLDDDAKAVTKWVKPARTFFKIEWRSGEEYAPDFVIETSDRKILAEVKRKDQLEQEEVKAKALAARTWCGYASKHELEHGGKRWYYLLIAHDEVQAGRTLDGLIATFADAKSGVRCPKCNQDGRGLVEVKVNAEKREFFCEKCRRADVSRRGE